MHADPLARPRGSESDFQEAGRKILTNFFAALRALRLYPVENSAVQQTVDDLHESIDGLVRAEEGLEIRVVGDFFFLNEVRLRLGLSNYSTFGIFAQALRSHGLGVVEIMQGVQREEWIPFLSLLSRKVGSGDPFDSFLVGLDETPIQHLNVRPEQDIARPDLESRVALDTAKRTYTKSVRVAKEALTDIRLGRAVNVRRLKRAVQGIVDQILQDEPSIVTMTTLREFDEYTFTHSVNVCIFSVILGQKLGLSKLQLYELGLSALFHDVGKMRVEPELVAKTEKLTSEEWAQFKEHPTEGLLVLFQLQGFADVPYRQMLVAYEHHMKVDRTGYPTGRRSAGPGLFSRIVAVADGFDAGTSVRSYQYRPWPPDEVLKEMRDNPARGFDPLLVKLLINATGVFPAGTLVILDTHELAVVVRTNLDAEKVHMPLIKVISDSMGLPLTEPRVVDLSEVNAQGKPLHTVIKTTDPEKYGIRVSDYIT